MFEAGNNAISPGNRLGSGMHTGSKRSLLGGTKFGIAGKLFLLSAMMFVGFSIISAFSTQKIYETIKNERVGKVRSLTEVAISIITTAYNQYKSGKLSED